MPQKAFDTLQKVADELLTVQEVLDQRRLDPQCSGPDKARLDEARAQTERTYLLRLLAEFEGALTRMGPDLRVPVSFALQDGLGAKLDRIGAGMHVDSNLRVEVDDKIRAHRNELAHGRSPVPRVSFLDSHQLMKSFLRYCF